MTAHDDDRAPGQGNAGHGAHDGTAYDDIAYDGTDALMAAILDEPLPARGRRDPAFLAAHGAAVADLAVLREQLALIGDALAAPAEAAPAGGEDDVPAGRGGAARPGGKRPEPDDGTGQGVRARPPGDPAPRNGTGNRSAAPGSGPGDRPVVTGTRARPGSSGSTGHAVPTGPTGSTGDAGPAASPRPAVPTASVTPAGPAGTTGSSGPSGPVRPGGSRGPRGPRRVRRPLGVAFGALAAAAAATVVAGMGWLVVQGGGGSDAASGSSEAAADSAAGKQGGVAFGSPRYLACARLVAEGAVVAVEPLPGAGRERITLRVSRAHKGTEDGHRVTFVLDAAGQPRLREGDRVMIGVPLEGDHPDTVVVGEEDIAPERARITASLPESRTLTCG
ncbi:hypothetical protein [Streptomyces griseomycini]|uniref:Uncharacterized protein n=1 Tax=Streptomyces griseomycini TaxID=66895 RepID=A0A7W7LW92_9ACTN|nr:hypothetical protein [Streptomyces griseomycini]MBB4896851.1 hypothetical protein [Streptomyces griseomycini]GGR15099.1 hypothetical protein GCM10015536_20810 [Streptomyces griseomycini]